MDEIRRPNIEKLKKVEIIEKPKNERENFLDSIKNANNIKNLKPVVVSAPQ